jgi:hypothetical protein
MFTFIFRKVQRAAMIVVLAIGSATVLADGASAAGKTLSGTYSRGQIMGACAATGGTYTDKGKTGGGAEYGCSTDKGAISCDGYGHCGGGCKKCADLLPTKGGVKGIVGGAGIAGNGSGTGRAHSASTNKVKQVTAISHLPLKKIATRTASHAR